MNKRACGCCYFDDCQMNTLDPQPSVGICTHPELFSLFLFFSAVANVALSFRLLCSVVKSLFI